MQKIIDQIVKFKEHLLFIGLIFISLSLILLGDVNKIGGYRTIVVGFLGWFQSKIFIIPNIAGLKSENSALRELNLNLSHRVIMSRIAEIENQSLRNMLGLQQRISIPYEVAEVVGSITSDIKNFLIINKGKRAGIRELMTVRNDAGLVGITEISSDKYSFVLTLFNPTIKVPAMCLRSGVEGTIAYETGNFLLLRNVPKYLDIKLGDTIVSSKNSLKFTPYVPIGIVVSINEVEGELFPKIVVKPFVNFGFIEQVFVLKNVIDEELINLIKKAEENLRLSQLPAPKNLILNIREFKDSTKVRQEKNRK
ncbi:MAG: rod shape-determining protein MreC [Candidatus Kapaibacteriales bacterium]